MVTRTVIRISPAEASASAAAKSVAAEVSISNKPAATEQIKKQCERHSTQHDSEVGRGGKKRKRALSSGDLGDDKERKKKKMQLNSFSVDLSDVPPQPPIPKNGGHIKEGASKYTGVYFDKWKNKWKAKISIEGKQHCIGYYENEEEAAIDYARAVFKYNGELK